MPELEHVPMARPRKNAHEVAVCPPPGEYAGNENRWELDCDVCGYIGAAGCEWKAREMADRHSVSGLAGCDLVGRHGPLVRR